MKINFKVTQNFADEIGYDHLFASEITDFVSKIKKFPSHKGIDQYQGIASCYQSFMLLDEKWSNTNSTNTADYHYGFIQI